MIIHTNVMDSINTNGLEKLLSLINNIVVESSKKFSTISRVPLLLSFENVSVNDLPSVNSFKFCNEIQKIRSLTLWAKYEHFDFITQLFSKLNLSIVKFKFLLLNSKFDKKLLHFCNQIESKKHDVLIDTRHFNSFESYKFLLKF